jgi:anti-sigma B factor antagonist
MTITKKKDADVLTVAIEGALDIKTAPELDKALEGELDDVKEVYFDMAKTEYISSAGLRIVLKTYQFLSQKDGRMVLKNVNDVFYDILQLSGFTSFLEVEKAEG